MSNLKASFLSSHYILLLVVILLLSACASMKSPQGGPKDTTPPKILKIEPKNFTTNFKAQKIVIDFDEYFKLQNQFKEFSISPELEKAPDLKVKQKKLEITLTDSLEKNTTYTVNFGNSIVDINENNILKNVTYAFSTGPKLDSLSINGKVTNSLTGQAEKDVLVFIFPLQRDTLFGKKRPSIFTYTDSSGNYSLKNLRKDTYKIYALKEQGGDKLYQQTTDEIGFIKDSIVLDKNLTDINLKVFKEKQAELRVLDKKINSDGSILVTLNKPLKKPEITVLEPKNLDNTKKYIFNQTNDSVKIWLNDLSFDSVKFTLKDGEKNLKNIMLSRGKKDTYTRNITAADNTKIGKLNPYKPYILTFNFPIIAADKSKIILLEDSVSKTNFELIKDSTNFLKYTIKYPWRNKRKYNIKFEANALSSIFETKNKEFTTSMELESTEAYGSLILKVEVPDSTKNYVIQLLNEQKTVLKSNPTHKNTNIHYPNYPAGKYFVRVVYDTNKNDEWDTGNLKLGLQPENIWQADKELSLRANWDREETLTVPKE